MPPNPGKKLGWWGTIHRVTKYGGFQDYRVKLSFSVVTFLKNIVIIQIGLN